MTARAPRPEMKLSVAAEFYRIQYDRLRALVMTGEVEGYDARKSGAGRANWFVYPDSIEDYRERMRRRLSA